MSGLAATIGLAQAGLAGAQQGATDAASQAGKNAAVAAELGAKMGEVAAKVGRFENDGWRVRRDGSLIWANIVITAMFDGKGALRGFSTITRNLTERRPAHPRRRVGVHLVPRVWR